MFSRPIEEPHMKFILSWCVCTAYGCCTLKHGNWKGQLARIGCRAHIMHVKFIYSEKATKFCEIFTLLLSCVVPVKSNVKISKNFVPSQNIWTLLDYFLFYFRQFTVKNPSDLYIYLTFFSILSIELRLSLKVAYLIIFVSDFHVNYEIHRFINVAVSCLSLHSLWVTRFTLVVTLMCQLWDTCN